MRHFSRQYFIVFILISTLSGYTSHLHAQPLEKRLIDLSGNNVETIDVASYFSIYPYGDTVRLYYLKDTKAVVKVRISNQSLSLPPTIKVYLFEHDITDQMVDKWLNNQLSDALFADAPVPVLNYQVKNDNISVKGQRLIDQTSETGGFEYDHYDVTLAVDSVSTSAFFLKAFSLQLSVYILTKDIQFD